jgi:hypothetical protein
LPLVVASIYPPPSSISLITFSFITPVVIIIPLRLHSYACMAPAGNAD